MTRRTRAKTPAKLPAKDAPMEIIMQTKFPEVNVMRAAAQSPAAQSVFAEINRRHGEDEDVVQRHGDRRCDLVASANPRHQNGKQRFEGIKRREPEKDSDRGPE